MHLTKLSFSFLAAVTIFYSISAEAKDTVLASCGSGDTTMNIVRTGFGPDAGKLHGFVEANGVRATLASCWQVNKYYPGATKGYVLYECESRWSTGQRLSAAVQVSFIGGKGHGSSQQIVAGGNLREANGSSKSLGVIQPCRVY